MAFTDNSDLYGAIHEEGINRVLRHVMRQRPSLFNYGTAWVAQKPDERLCERITVAPAVIQRGNPMITVEDPLPLLGTDGMYGINFCFQLTRAEIDFHPGNVFTLPPELAPLAPQRFAFHFRVCAGLGCPPKELIDQLQPALPDPGRPPGTAAGPTKERGQPKPPPVPIPTRKLECFCLDLYAVCHFEVTGPPGDQKLQGKVDGLEIVDIKPDGLENSLECYMNLMVRFVLLPRLSIAIGKFVFDIPNLTSIAIEATPTSAAVPYNPAIEEDQLKVFINVEAAP